MPVALTYPGVYVEEIPSGVRTITGVATSITAFLGRALRGPTNTPVTINSYADFERIFGGLWAPSSLGFAVRDFYLNGGSQAIIVRLFSDPSGAAQAAGDAATAASSAANATPQSVAAAAHGVETAETDASRKAAAAKVAAAADAAAAAPNATAASVSTAAANAVAGAAPPTKATIEYKGLKLVAAAEGVWGNKLRLRVDQDIADKTRTDLFNLSIRDDATGNVEVFRNVSVRPNDPRRVDRVLENESNLMRMSGTVPNNRPDPPHADPTNDKLLWEDNDTNSKVDNANFGSNGDALRDLDFDDTNFQSQKKGLYALENADLFNLLCIPPYNADNNTSPTVVSKGIAYCKKRRAMMIVDPLATWNTKDKAKSNVSLFEKSSYAALYFPRLRQPNPLRDDQIEDFAPCGAVAGVMARTDSERGVWKAPAGLSANLFGVPQLSVPLTDAENGELNPLAVNCLRTLPAAGRVVWGARTLEGDDRLTSEWKYVPVRRTALFIEERLYRGMQWVVFEPNDEPLWAQIRLNAGAFMHNLFRQGAFQGQTPKDAYFVKCDKETTTQNDIDLGIVNIVVGFAPLKPAEFVVIKLQQIAGQIET